MLIASQAVTTANGVISLPVELVAQGGENGLTFSVHYDPAVLGYEGFEPGTDARAGATFLENAAHVARGRVGFGMVLRPAASYDAGTERVAESEVQGA